MTGQDLLDSMEYVDPKLIEAAENPPRKKSYPHPFILSVRISKKRRSTLTLSIAMQASIACLLRPFTQD